MQHHNLAVCGTMEVILNPIVCEARGKERRLSHLGECACNLTTSFIFVGGMEVWVEIFYKKHAKSHISKGLGEALNTWVS